MNKVIVKLISSLLIYLFLSLALTGFVFQVFQLIKFEGANFFMALYDVFVIMLKIFVNTTVKIDGHYYQIGYACVGILFLLFVPIIKFVEKFIISNIEKQEAIVWAEQERKRQNLERERQKEFMEEVMKYKHLPIYISFDVTKSDGFDVQNRDEVLQRLHENAKANITDVLYSLDVVNNGKSLYISAGFGFNIDFLMKLILEAIRNAKLYCNNNNLKLSFIVIMDAIKEQADFQKSFEKLSRIASFGFSDMVIGTAHFKNRFDLIEKSSKYTTTVMHSNKNTYMRLYLLKTKDQHFVD